MNDVVLARIIIGGACLLLIVAIWFIGRPRKPRQGRRLEGRETAGTRTGAARSEPTLGEMLEQDSQHDGSPGTKTEQARLDALERSLASGLESAESARSGSRPSMVDSPRAPHRSQPALGVRPDDKFDRIVTLFVAARAGHQLSGPDLVVAAEKAGLVHGYMDIYHRLVDGKPEVGPVFSVANMVKPGNFDLTRLQELRTPGISFFMTLPAPVSALDAWDTMLPTAQRMAELLDALVLDEERNALGRQRIAHIRDEMRAYDRKREQQTIRPTLR
jgi:cell division protein ZipA